METTPDETSGPGGNPRVTLAVVLFLADVLVPAYFCDSWVPWLRLQGTVIVVLIVVCLCRRWMPALPRS